MNDPDTPAEVALNAELDRLRSGIALCEGLRELFGRMEDDKERKRAWDYLRNLYPEFEKADKPSHWEPLIGEDESCKEEQ